MLIFRDEVDIDRCYLMEMLKRSKKVAKELCSPIEKLFLSPGHAGIHLDLGYLLVVFKRSKTVAKGLF